MRVQFRRPTPVSVHGRRRLHLRGDIADVADEIAERLIAGGRAEPVEAERSDEQLAAMTVDDLLTYVGDDPDRAARVLALEEGKGGKARSTLVEPLKALGA